jgi:hypothetical protein
LSARSESGHAALKKTAELKIVNEVGSQCSPNLEQNRAGGSNPRPLTPPSLDLVDEELSRLGAEAEADASASQKLLAAVANDDDDDDDLDFDDDDDVVRWSRWKAVAFS